MLEMQSKRALIQLMFSTMQVKKLVLVLETFLLIIEINIWVEN